ncbi:MAG TPA: translation elongation factor Ts [Geobacterales bacterium]|nr:translation elongation factor Ts [Geobacterales bacterium]
MEISAAQVSELRKQTGAGLMDCKKALAETAGNLEKAVDLLRTKGLAAAAKKAGRAATEGTVAAIVSPDGHRGVLIEVNSETDFVAKNETFQSFVKGVAEHISVAAPADMDALFAQPFTGAASKTVQVALNEAIAVIGENLQIRRFDRYEVAAGSGMVGAYVHAGGKIGVIVELAGSGDLAALARDVAMHIAAAAPQYVRREEVSNDVLEREKEIYRAKARETGKPENIIEKIIGGQVGKFYGDICLLEQPFVKDTDKTVQQILKEAGGATVTRFARFVLGEGLAKKECDFAAEVAATVGSK